MQIEINYNSKKIKLKAKETNFLSKGFGLMFRGRNTDNLLFNFNKNGKVSITSFFVFFPFLAIWLDENNKVLELKIVQPFKISVVPSKPFRRLIEIPFNEKNKSAIKFFVGKRRKV